MGFTWPGYAPRGYASCDALIAAEADALEPLLGMRICNAYCAWDIRAERWCGCAPVVLELDTSRLEIGFGDNSRLALSIDAIDLSRAAGMGGGEASAIRERYEWRTDRRELAPYMGSFMLGIDLLVRRGAEEALAGCCIRTDRGGLDIVNTGAERAVHVSFCAAGELGDDYKRMMGV